MGRGMVPVRIRYQDLADQISSFLMWSVCRITSTMIENERENGKRLKGYERRCCQECRDSGGLL